MYYQLNYKAIVFNNEPTPAKDIIMALYGNMANHSLDVDSQIFEQNFKMLAGKLVDIYFAEYFEKDIAEFNQNQQDTKSPYYPLQLFIRDFIGTSNATPSRSPANRLAAKQALEQFVYLFCQIEDKARRNSLLATLLPKFNACAIGVIDSINFLNMNMAIGKNLFASWIDQYQRQVIDRETDVTLLRLYPRSLIAPSVPHMRRLLLKLSNELGLSHWPQDDASIDYDARLSKMFNADLKHDFVKRYCQALSINNIVSYICQQILEQATTIQVTNSSDDAPHKSFMVLRKYLEDIFDGVYLSEHQPQLYCLEYDEFNSGWLHEQAETQIVELIKLKLAKEGLLLKPKPNLISVESAKSIHLIELHALLLAPAHRHDALYGNQQQLITALLNEQDWPVLFSQALKFFQQKIDSTLLLQHSAFYLLLGHCLTQNTKPLSATSQQALHYLWLHFNPNVEQAYTKKQYQLLAQPYLAILNHIPIDNAIFSLEQIESIHHALTYIISTLTAKSTIDRLTIHALLTKLEARIDFDTGQDLLLWLLIEPLIRLGKIDEKIRQHCYRLTANCLQTALKPECMATYPNEANKVITAVMGYIHHQTFVPLGRFERYKSIPPLYNLHFIAKHAALLQQAARHYCSPKTPELLTVILDYLSFCRQLAMLQQGHEIDGSQHQALSALSQNSVHLYQLFNQQPALFKTLIATLTTTTPDMPFTIKLEKWLMLIVACTWLSRITYFLERDIAQVSSIIGPLLSNCLATMISHPEQMYELVRGANQPQQLSMLLLPFSLPSDVEDQLQQSLTDYVPIMNSAVAQLELAKRQVLFIELTRYITEPKGVPCHQSQQPLLLSVISALVKPEEANQLLILKLLPMLSRFGYDNEQVETFLYKLYGCKATFARYALLALSDYQENLATINQLPAGDARSIFYKKTNISLLNQMLNSMILYHCGKEDMLNWLQLVLNITHYQPAVQFNDVVMTKLLTSNTPTLISKLPLIARRLFFNRFNRYLSQQQDVAIADQFLCSLDDEWLCYASYIGSNQGNRAKLFANAKGYKQRMLKAITSSETYLSTDIDFLILFFMNLATLCPENLLDRATIATAVNHTIKYTFNNALLKFLKEGSGDSNQFNQLLYNSINFLCSLTKNKDITLPDATITIAFSRYLSFIKKFPKALISMPFTVASYRSKYGIFPEARRKQSTYESFI